MPLKSCNDKKRKAWLFSVHRNWIQSFHCFCLAHSICSSEDSPIKTDFIIINSISKFIMKSQYLPHNAFHKTNLLIKKKSNFQVVRTVSVFKFIFSFNFFFICVYGFNSTLWLEFLNMMLKISFQNLSCFKRAMTWINQI